MGHATPPAGRCEGVQEVTFPCNVGSNPTLTHAGGRLDQTRLEKRDVWSLIEAERPGGPHEAAEGRGAAGNMNTLLTEEEVAKRLHVSLASIRRGRLQQLAGGMAPTDDGVVHRIDNSKQKLLSDVLEDIGTDEPVVVFCRFHADLDARPIFAGSCLDRADG